MVLSGLGWSPADVAYFHDKTITICDTLGHDDENTSTEVSKLLKEPALTQDLLQDLYDAARRRHVLYSNNIVGFAKTIDECQQFLRRYGPLQLRLGSDAISSSPISPRRKVSQSIIWSHEGDVEADSLRKQLCQYTSELQEFLQLNLSNTMSFDDDGKNTTKRNQVVSESDIKHRIVESFSRDLPTALVYSHEGDDDESSDYDPRLPQRFRSSSIYSDSWSFSDGYSDAGSSFTTVTRSPMEKDYDMYDHDPRTGARMMSHSSASSRESAGTTPRSSALTVHDQLAAFQLDDPQCRSESPNTYSDSASVNLEVDSIEIRRRRAEMARSDSPTLPSSPSFEDLPIEMMDSSFFVERQSPHKAPEDMSAVLKNIHTHSIHLHTSPHLHSPPNIKSPLMNEKMMIPNLKHDTVAVIPDNSVTKFYGKFSIISRCPGPESRCQFLLNDVKSMHVKTRDGSYRLKSVTSSNASKETNITHYFEAKPGSASIPHIDQPLTNGSLRFRVKFLPYAWISIEDARHKKKESSKSPATGLEYWFEEEDDYLRFQKAVHGRDLLKCLAVNEICYVKDKMRSNRPICLTQMLRIWKEPDSTEKTIMFFANVEQKYHDINVAYFSYFSSGTKVTLELNPNPPQLGEMAAHQASRSQSLSNPSTSNSPSSSHRPRVASSKTAVRSSSVSSTSSSPSETLDLIYTWKQEKWKALVIEFSSPQDAKTLCELLRQRT